MKQSNEISRAQFLKGLGLSTKALMAVYCLGAVSACSKDEVEPNSTNNNSGGGNASSGLTGKSTGTSIDFSVDLTNATYSKLKTKGEFMVIGDVIVANANGNFVALSKTCTHQGTTINFRSATNDFRCPNHGAEYSINGDVTKAPAPSALKKYSTTLSTNGNTLTIKA